jgi:PAS domain S-box-containing protein
VLSIGVYFLAAGRIKADPVAQSQASQPASSSPLPMVTIVVVSAWLVLFAMKGHPATEAISPIFWILAVLFVILSVRETYFIRDSQRWMSAEIEKKSRARFEAVVQNSSDVIMVVDTELVVRFASPASAEALGRPPEEIAGKALLSFVHPDDLQKGAAFLDSVKAPYMEPPTILWRMSRPDGTHRHFETVGSNLIHEPALGGLVLNSRDVTDRVTLEEKLRQTQKLEALGQLVGGIAHNFNNILTSTMMRLSFLRVDRKLPADLLEEIQALEKEAKRTAALTKKLVMFGQQQILIKETINLGDRLTGLHPEIARIMGKDIQVYMTGVSSPQWVDVDAGLIDQVILSLCANARDAMATGGCLILELSEFNPGSAPAQRDGEARRGSFARLSFQDTGCGMDSAVRQHLFEPFFTTKGLGEAEGLGLAVVHGIVKQHGGWMEVDSSPGLGSTFRVFLPKAPRTGG